ncbi:MAG TPA: 4'-phosphopantetheinyl transferase superfamily protein [Flavobacterium sp.]|nr:4'-phosphopantetheinyl transferase superfamily protein [Flavobacterium sp.]
MPLYRAIKVDDTTQVLVWKVTESFAELYRETPLRDVCLYRLEQMKSEVHQRCFLSVRKLLAQAGYTDFDLAYNNNGKPMLLDGNHISITHSFDFSAIIISDRNTGIDLEQQREKIIRIAHKFTKFDNDFFDKSNKTQTIRQLTAIWGIKEAIYKFYSIKGLSLKEHINVLPFAIDSGELEAIVTYGNFHYKHQARFEEFESYTMTYLL